jgi:hypothetical protein
MLVSKTFTLTCRVSFFLAYGGYDANEYLPEVLKGVSGERRRPLQAPEYDERGTGPKLTRGVYFLFWKSAA